MAGACVRRQRRRLLLLWLTGYLLFWPFVKRDYGPGDPVALGRYAANRILRILPLYYVVVIIVLAVQYDVGDLGTWLRFLTFSENFSHDTVAQYVGPAWSIVIELYFYLLLPLIAAGIAWVARGSAKTAALCLLAMGLVSFIARQHTVLLPAAGESSLWRFSLPTTFLFFVPGMLLALLRLEWESRKPAALSGRLGNADLWFLASLPFWAIVVFLEPRWDPLLCFAAFMVIGACVLPLRTGRLGRGLEWRWIALIGVASYSLYLWHYPVINALVDLGIPTGDPGFVERGVVALPVSLLIAAISYRVVERPFLRLRQQWSRSAAPQSPSGLTTGGTVATGSPEHA